MRDLRRAREDALSALKDAKLRLQAVCLIGTASVEIQSRHKRLVRLRRHGHLLLVGDIGSGRIGGSRPCMVRLTT
jgi:hypothetical protein